MNNIGLVQMRSSASIEDNLNFVKQMAEQAYEASVSVLVLPENFAFMGSTERLLEIAEPYKEGAIQEKIAALARAYNLWIIAGTIPIKTAGSRVRARNMVIDNRGQHVAFYDKIHLFDVHVSDSQPYQESKTTEPGDKPVVVATPIGKVGLTVCYDLRFPELYQKLLFEGAELFTVPSAFTAVTGQAHWSTLLKARAIENLSYVVASAQYGQHENGRHTYGHSMVIEPWGSIIAHKEEGLGLVTASIDLHRLHQLRKQFPCTEHHVLV